MRYCIIIRRCVVDICDGPDSKDKLVCQSCREITRRPTLPETPAAKTK